MREEVIARLKQRFAAYADLAVSLDDELLTRKIDLAKHKNLAEHLWCVVGARESYARAIAQGSWAGFNCSMEAFTAEDFRVSLDASAAAVVLTLDSVVVWDAGRTSLLATLAEHEVMHEGQIIRHMYALETTLPDSWKWA